ncbi:PREDICTED: endoplasmin-like [Dipodomys ordii]|uniref:Endoplasmin-like n=1 Tax=Dipodomys ordii TaxID=10020 RepID=A0A1S3GV09_DIPOR|nr:PREDICTED: endoplasmin-like [Dipodomys ordii]
MEEEEAAKEDKEEADDEAAVEEEEEEKKPKTKKVEKTVWDWELMNDIKPIWQRPSKEVEEDEYKAFYKSFSKVNTVLEFSSLRKTLKTTGIHLSFRSITNQNILLINR